MIKDSGARTEFESGAVRDIKDDVGRCDLLPLREVACVLDDDYLAYLANYIEDYKDGVDDTLKFYNNLGCAIAMFSGEVSDICEDIENAETMMLELSMHFKEGAEKYGEYNWQKGIPAHSYVDSAIRHYLKYQALMDDERHDRAHVWNLICLMWTLKNKPECDDLKGINLKRSEENEI